jgi:hypothetical protein
VFFGGSIDNIGGSITFVADSLIGAGLGAHGSGILTTISFTALGVGSSAVSLFNVSAFDSFGEGIAVTSTNSAVNVGASTVVPEPTPLVLLGSGVLGLLIVNTSKHRVRVKP